MFSLWVHSFVVVLIQKVPCVPIGHNYSHSISSRTANEFSGGHLPPFGQRIVMRDQQGSTDTNKS